MCIAHKGGMFFLAVMFTSMVCLGHGSVHERINGLSHMIEDDPDDAQLFIDRGRLWLLDESPSHALRDFEKALSVDPDLEEAVLLKAAALLDLEQYKEAAGVAVHYLDEYGDHAEVCIILARSHMGLGNYKRAVDSYSRAFAFIPHVSPDLYLEQARAAASRGEQGVRQAIILLEQAMSNLGRIVSLESAARNYSLRLEQLKTETGGS